MHKSPVLFEERDGLYWLSGPDLARANAMFRLDCQGKAVGFDPEMTLVYVNQFLGRHIKVGIQRGNTVRMLRLRRHIKREPIPYEYLFLAPRLLFDGSELGGLRSRLTAKRSPLRDAAERITRIQMDDGEAALSDLGEVYVFEVWDNAYDVDWELTTMSQLNFEALALVAHENGGTLACRLVLPKARRSHNCNDGQSRRDRHPQFADPITYGQLHLPI